jgi:hypothetical protein
VGRHSEPFEINGSLALDQVLTREIVLRSCRGLVQIEEGSETAILADREIEVTVPDYWGEEPAYRDSLSDLAEACLKYLLLDEFSQGPCTTPEQLQRRYSTWPFLQYAACNWLHVFAQKSTDDLRVLVDRFLSSPQHVASATQAMESLALDLDADADFESSIARYTSTSALQMVASLGLSQLLRDSHIVQHDKLQLLDQSESVDLVRQLVRTLTGNPSKHQEFNKAHPPITPMGLFKKELLKNLLLSDTTAMRESAQEILRWCIDHGDSSAVQKVLQARDDTSRKEAWPTSRALTLAIDRTNVNYDIVKVLLAQCSLKDIEQHTPLQAACEHGHTQVVRLLLQQRVFLGQPKQSSYQPPLHYAVRNKNLDIVRALLSSGAIDVLDQHSGETALHLAAAMQDSEDLVALLLANTLDANCQNKMGLKPRDVASSHRIQALFDNI